MLLYAKFAVRIFTDLPDAVLIPISQTTSGFLKDSVFIFLSLLFHRKTIVQLRGSNFQNWLKGANGLMARWAIFLLRRCAAAIVLGWNLKFLFAEVLPDEKIHVVPNGGNYDFGESKAAEGIVNVLYLSNLQNSKGIEDLITAIRSLRSQTLPPFQVKVVGEWYELATENWCRNEVRKFDLPVSFHSPQVGDTKLECYENADIFVFPPRLPEGHPWVLVEAMAAGLPIISTDQGAIRESVLNGVNGFIVESHRPEQIAEKLKLLIEDPELRKRMGAESRRLYEERFTEEKMVENLSRVFHQVLSSSH